MSVSLPNSADGEIFVLLCGGYWYQCTDDHLLKCMIQSMDLPTCRFEMYLRLYMFTTSIPKIMIFIRVFEKQDFWNISIISIKGEEDLIL